MTHASVFSGIGGPEVAATMLGWENLFHCEINPFGKQVLDYWYPNAESYDDITKTDFRKWRGRVNVLTGGFPCQPFSYAGQRRGATDDRYLWPHMFRCIDEIRPDWVVAENVAGILTMVEQGEVSEMASQATLFDEGDDVRGYKLRETFTLQRICSDLESHGYAVQPVLVPACAVGAPHRRDRVFIVARRMRNAPDTPDNGLEHTADTRAESELRETLRGQGSGSELHVSAETDGSGRTTADTSDARAEGVRQERQDAVYRPEPTADTEGECGQRMRPGEREAGESEQVELGGSRGESSSDYEAEIRRDAPNPNFYRMERDVWTRFCNQSQSGLLTEESANRNWNLWKEQRWEHFPTVPPIHRRNDGLPLLVDHLTLSFGKWRTEALKAYGNAIVPQVMYEIFRAIEIVENSAE